MQILHSSLNTTFIQLSTRHNCFSLAHFSLICICANFRLIFFLCISHFIKPISHSSVTNVVSWFNSFVFHLFCCIFSIYIFCIYRFMFSILTLSYRLWCTIMFFFFNHRISFIFAQIVDTPDGEQVSSFVTFHYGLTSRMSFRILYIVWIDSYFVGALFPFN